MPGVVDVAACGSSCPAAVPRTCWLVAEHQLVEEDDTVVAGTVQRTRPEQEALNLQQQQ